MRRWVRFRRCGLAEGIVARGRDHGDEKSNEQATGPRGVLPRADDPEKDGNCGKDRKCDQLNQDAQDRVTVEP